MKTKGQGSGGRRLTIIEAYLLGAGLWAETSVVLSHFIFTTLLNHHCSLGKSGLEVEHLTQSQTKGKEMRFKSKLMNLKIVISITPCCHPGRLS
jgi:hypothetical protein